MKITINIDERTGTAIREFCKANNLKQNQYLVDIIEKQFNIDRFGDLNELITKKEKLSQPKMELVIDEKPEITQSSSVEEPKPEEPLVGKKPRKRTLIVK